MAVEIIQLLRTSSVGADRANINSNFLILKEAYNTLEGNLGISVSQKSINLSEGSGSGIIKSKSIVIGNTVNGNLQITDDSNVVKASISISSGEGLIVTDNLQVNSLLETSNIDIDNNLSVSGVSTFSQSSTFNGSIKINGGISYKSNDIGIVSDLPSKTYTVLYSNHLIKIDFDTNGLILDNPSPELPNGHEIKILSSGSSGGTLDSTFVTNSIAGWDNITFDNGNYKSILTLSWDSDLSQWIVINYIGCTLS